MSSGKLLLHGSKTFRPLWIIGIILAVAASLSTAGAQQLIVKNDFVSVALDTEDGTLTMTDHRCGKVWRQSSAGQADGKVKAAEIMDEKVGISWVWTGAEPDVRCELVVEPDRPEFVVELSAMGSMKSIRYPHPVVTEAGNRLIMPANEGISYPVEDKSIEMRQQYFTADFWAFSGHMGICMPFWAVKDGDKAQMCIIETPDDATVRLERMGPNLTAVPRWESQKGRFGYTRRLRYVLFDKGGHVAVAKRYRRHAQRLGLVKTLKAKRAENPNVDVLIGGVNVWCRAEDPLPIVREMKSLGIKKILWSDKQNPETVRKLNAIDNVLTNRYENYCDVMDPQIVKEKLGGGWSSEWKRKAWPEDMIINSQGRHARGWAVYRDGQTYWCSLLCASRALDHTRDRVPGELEESPETCRFLDVTCATPWQECYAPDHPMTRSQSKYWRMRLLKFMSEDMGLVTGSETGHQAAVPYVHYWEGMMSLARYRVDEAGRNMGQILHEVPERVSKFQLGQKYRLPLWELVFGDCVVSQWYWGDYNNKLPKLWKKRDLFNILYGTAPMFMFDKEFWEENKQRFARSYRNISEVTEAVGYARMLDHEFLDADRDVQRTTFSNGVVVTVNFGSEPYETADGMSIESMGYRVEGL